MTLFQKVAAARLELQSMNLKKSGTNSYAKYNYYELKDFLPAINDLATKHGFLCVTTFSREGDRITLYIYDSDDTTVEPLEFSSPIADATTKGQIPIQGLGSMHTYLRRYLYMLAFEIVENDYVDAVHGGEDFNPAAIKKNNTPVTPATKVISEAVVNDIWNAAKAKGHTAQSVTQAISAFGWSSLRQVTTDKAAEVRKVLGVLQDA